MRLLCLSDLHGATRGLATLLHEAGPLDVVVVAGDITHLGGRQEAQVVLDPIGSTGARVVAVAGNMDPEPVQGYLRELGIDLHRRGILVGEVGFMGLGGGTPSPFHSPWEVENEEAERCLEEGLAQIAEARFKVLVAHPPPRNTALDRSVAFLHVGSEPVRRFLDAGHADLCICGHIHESGGVQIVGGATCVNLGPYTAGNYALVTIEGGRATVTRRTTT